MAEDKRIRVTADVTPLRQLREEAVSLYREIDQAASMNSQNTEKHLQQLREQLSLMEDRNQLEKLLIDLRRQSTSMQAPEVQQPISTPLPQQQTQRELKPVYDENANSITWEVNKETEIQPDDEEITKPSRKPKKRPKRKIEYQEDVEPVIDEETGSVSWDLRRPTQETPIERKPTETVKETIKETQKEILSEINRHVENIDNSVTNIDNSKENVDNSVINTDNSRRVEDRSENYRHIENNQENIAENVVNIERNVHTITENTNVIRERESVTKPNEQSTRPILSEDERIQRRPEITDNNNQITGFSDERIVNAIIGLGTIADNTRREIIASLKDLTKGEGEEKKNSNITRYLETIANSLSITEDNVQEILEELHNTSGGGGRGGDNTSPTPFIGGGSGGAGGLSNLLGLIPGLGLLRGAGLLKGLLGGISLIGAANTAKNILSERYFRNEAFDYRSQYQGTIETEVNRRMVNAANEADKYRWIPFVGNIIARNIEQPAQLWGEKIRETTQKYFEAERRIVPYAQTMGVSAGQSMRQAGREGGYAASALGMDYASYLGRRTELIRAGGGRFVGGNEYDPYAVRETQSVMAAERLFGLSSNTINRLQGAMRFGDENMNIGASAVIREFEQVMRNLNLPFAEIASTMEESLDTFIKQSDQILSKSGEFRAQELVAMLNAIRETTGLRGKQLERVQQAFTGQGMSKNEVVNAMLVRAIQEEMPDKTSYSEIQEEIEKTRAGGADPRVMENFFNKLIEVTGGGVEQLRLHMSEVFPDLPWGSINDAIREGSNPSEIFRELFDLYQKSLGRLQENSTEAYDKRAAARTVGFGESMQASDTNKQIGEGAKSLGDIWEQIQRIIALMEQSKKEGRNLMEDRSQINTNQSDALPSYKPLIPERIPLVGSTQPDSIKQFEETLNKVLDKKFKEYSLKDEMRSRLPQER
jgi:hypothetical protein